jgi:hypothetical protein
MVICCNFYFVVQINEGLVQLLRQRSVSHPLLLMVFPTFLVEHSVVTQDLVHLLVSIFFHFSLYYLLFRFILFDLSHTLTGFLFLVLLVLTDFLTRFVVMFLNFSISQLLLLLKHFDCLMLLLLQLLLQVFHSLLL